jgi:hypothetical protein
MSGMNDDVIDQLQQIIQQLNERRTELDLLQQQPGGPLSERADRQALVLERLISINLRIHHLDKRLTDREIAHRQKATVPPLPDDRRQAMADALQAVSQSIAAVQDFQAKIALAEAISTAASKAEVSSGIG